MKKYLFFTIFLTGCVFTLNAQIKSEIQIGVAVPQGDFADDDEYDAIFYGSGVAGTGFYLGYKLISPLSVDGLYWTFNAGIMYNDLQKDFKDDMEEDMEDADEFKLPKYLNVPILFGLQYERPISDGLNLFGEAGVGLNLLKLTKIYYSEEYDGEDYEESYKFNISAGFGFKIGAGIVLKDKYVISLNYLGLGSHKVKYEYEEKYPGESYSEDDKFEKDLPVSSVNVTFGFRF